MSFGPAEIALAVLPRIDCVSRTDGRYCRLIFTRFTAEGAQQEEGFSKRSLLQLLLLLDGLRWRTKSRLSEEPKAGCGRCTEQAGLGTSTDGRSRNFRGNLRVPFWFSLISSPSQRHKTRGQRLNYVGCLKTRSHDGDLMSCVEGIDGAKVNSHHEIILEGILCNQRARHRMDTSWYKEETPNGVFQRFSRRGFCNPTTSRRENP